MGPYRSHVLPGNCRRKRPFLPLRRTPLRGSITMVRRLFLLAIVFPSSASKKARLGRVSCEQVALTGNLSAKRSNWQASSALSTGEVSFPRRKVGAPVLPGAQPRVPRRSSFPSGSRGRNGGAFTFRTPLINTRGCRIPPCRTHDTRPRPSPSPLRRASLLRRTTSFYFFHSAAPVAPRRRSPANRHLRCRVDRQRSADAAVGLTCQNPASRRRRCGRWRLVVQSKGFEVKTLSALCTVTPWIGKEPLRVPGGSHRVLRDCLRVACSVGLR